MRKHLSQIREDRRRAWLGLVFVCLALPGGCRARSPFRPEQPSIGTPEVLGQRVASDIQLVSHQEAEAVVAMVEPLPLFSLPAPEGPAVSLSELEEIALMNNPSLSQAMAEIDAAEGRWVQAGLWPNPTVAYLGNEMGNQGAAGQQGGFLGQKFITAHKRALAREVRAREIEIATQRWDMQRIRVLTDVRLGFYETLIAQRRLAVTQQMLEISRKAVNTVEQLRAGMLASRIELLQAQVEVDAAEIQHTNAGNEQVAAIRKLAATVGVPGMALQNLQGDVTELEPALTWEDTLLRLKSESPEIAAAMANIDRAEQALLAAEAQAVPDVTVQVGMQHDNNTGDPITGLQVSLPLPLLNRNQGTRQARLAEISAAGTNIHRLELDLERRLAELFVRYRNAESQVHRYHDSLLPRAQESLELVTDGYQAGELDYLKLLTAQRTYFQANLQYLDSLSELWQAHVEANGLLLKDGLQSPESD